MHILNVFLLVYMYCLLYYSKQPSRIVYFYLPFVSQYPILDIDLKTICLYYIATTLFSDGNAKGMVLHYIEY